MKNQNRATKKIGGIGVAMILAVFAVFATTEATAQQLPAQFGGDSHPGMDVMSFAVHGGGFFSASSFAGGARFDDTSAFGASATFWAHRNLGIRGNFLWYSPDVLEGAEADLAILGEDPDIFHYSGDLVLRMPVPAGDNMSWFPYLLAGVGGKTYDFSTLDNETDVTGNVGLGLELRFGQDGRFGINTEVRDYISNFTVGEVDETLHDVIWTGGLSINF